MGGSERMARGLRRAEAHVLRAAAVLLLGGATLPPLLLLAGDALLHPGALQRSLEALGSGTLLRLWRDTWLLALEVTALSVLAGLPLGFLFGRFDLPSRGSALLLHLFPLFLPPFLLALGWFHLFGQGGALGAPATAAVLFSPPGCVALLTLTFTPVVTVLVALALQGMDASLEEVARVVAGPWRVATRILLPAIWPAAALGGLLVFTLSFSELGVPMFLRVRVFSGAVFARLGGIEYAPEEAFALTVPLLMLALVLLELERRLSSRSFTVRGLRQEKPPLPLGRLRWPLAVGVWSWALLSLMPLAGLALRAWRRDGFSAAPEWVGSSLVNSLRLAGLGATAMVGLGLIAGHALARGWRPARWVERVAMLGFVTPAAVLGTGLVVLWNRPATQEVYASAAILAIGAVARYGVLPLKLLSTAMAQSSRSLEDAATVMGASYLRRLMRIVVPLHRRALMGAWILAAIFCLRDLETSVLFYPPGGEPLTVRLFTLEANGPEGAVAALALLQVGLTALAVVLGWALLSRRRG